MNRSQEAGARSTCCSCSFWADVIYDAVAVAISVTDVATDVLVTLEFYESGYMIFFWFSIAIFVLAQLIYSGIFCVIIPKATWSYPARGALFVIVFPFAQLVPSFIWFTSFDIPCVNAFLNYCDFWPARKPDPDANTDPLRTYILTKVETHGGFMVEALVEAVSQSILQMIAAITLHHITDIGVLSITISMISVASKGLLLSYSLDRPTFLFNMLCFVGDVFGIFATTAWLFYSPRGGYGDGTATYTIFYMSGTMGILPLLWFYKFFVLSCMISFLGLCVWTRVLVRKYKRSDELSPRRVIELMIFAIIQCVLFLPGMMLVEACKLSLIPLLFLKSIHNAHATACQFFRPIFEFFREEPDVDQRICAANYFMAKEFMKHPVSYGRPDEDAKRRRRAKIFSEWEFDDFDLSTVRHVMGYSASQLVNTYGKIVQLETEKRLRNQDNDLFCEEYIQLGIVAFAAYILGPVMIVSHFYSLIYPVLALMTAQKYHYLQSTLTWIYIGVMVILLALVPPVYKFKYMTMHFIPFYDRGFKVEWVAGIREEYSRCIHTPERNRRIREKFGQLGFADGAKVVLSYLPKLHVIGDRDDEYRRMSTESLHARASSYDSSRASSRAASADFVDDETVDQGFGVAFDLQDADNPFAIDAIVAYAANVETELEEKTEEGVS